MSEGLQPESPTSRYTGMTINERLFAAGLLDAWDRAARARDRQAMIDNLLSVGIAEWFAAKTADTVLANPAAYGF